MLTPEDVSRTVRRLLDLTPELRDRDWCLVGTAAALLQGVSLPAGDIDILVRERGLVDAVARALADYRCPVPPLLEGVQYWTRFEVDGVRVEVSTVEVETAAEAAETIGAGPWRYRRLLRVGEHRVPVIPLEIRAVTEVYRSRADRAEPLLAHLAAFGFDAALLERALRRLPEQARAPVRRRLGLEDPSVSR